MESPIEKPFKCSTCFQQPGSEYQVTNDHCRFEMSFTNEDHLQVHRKRHEMSLSLGLSNNSEVQVAEGFTDETPTPTRFFRISEEVGFFQDIQNVNPFDEQFARATSSGSSNENGNFSLSLSTLCSNDTLNTPQVLGFSTSTPLPIQTNATPKHLSTPSKVPLALETVQHNSIPANTEKDSNGIPETQSFSASSSESNSKDGGGVYKRIELLERNRAAAVRSRERRRQWVSELEIKNKQLITLLGQVQAELKSIRLENLHLKEVLSLHSNCNVSQESLNKSHSSSVVSNPEVLKNGNPPRTGVPILPKLKEQSEHPSATFSKPLNTKCKRGRPRKGFEKRAALMLPPATPPSLTPPLKIQIVPFQRQATSQPSSSPSVIVFHRGTTAKH